MNHDLDKLARKLRNLDTLLGRLAAAERRKELIKIIRIPGWTTPAEFLLVSSIVESVSAQLKVLEELEVNLLEASRMVGKEARHASKQ
ncbi:MAG TPA: hypothetical protein VFZ48_03155 [Candidatus Saccharimonadales bacterium]